MYFQPQTIQKGFSRHCLVLSTLYGMWVGRLGQNKRENRLSVMAGFNCQVDTIWSHLGWEGLSKSGQSVGTSVGIILMTLIKMGKNHPLWGAPFPSKGIMNYVKAVKEVSTSTHALIHCSLLSTECDTINSCCLDFPGLMDWNLEL